MNKVITLVCLLALLVSTDALAQTSCFVPKLDDNGEIESEPICPEATIFSCSLSCRAEPQGWVCRNAKDDTEFKVSILGSTNALIPVYVPAAVGDLGVTLSTWQWQCYRTGPCNCVFNPNTDGFDCSKGPDDPPAYEDYDQPVGFCTVGPPIGPNPPTGP